MPKLRGTAVVPGYYLVCYNSEKSGENPRPAVVPGYYLVCYNIGSFNIKLDTL